MAFHVLIKRITRMFGARLDLAAAPPDAQMVRDVYVWRNMKCVHQTRLSELNGSQMKRLRKRIVRRPMHKI